MGGLLQRSGRTCTAALCQPTTATATADLQSIDAIHCAPIARDPPLAGTAKRPSEIRGGLAFGRKSTRRGRSLSSAAGYSDGDSQRPSVSPSELEPRKSHRRY